MHKRFGALSSSVNPQELGLTIQSAVRLAIGLLATLGVIGVTGGDALIEQIPAIVAAAYAAWQALEMLWGIARKLLVAFADTE